jgi:hypothetical protein
MSDVTVARLSGSLFSLGGLALGAVSWLHDWTLFLPFAVAMVGMGIGFQLLAFSLRRSNR